MQINLSFKRKQNQLIWAAFFVQLYVLIFSVYHLSEPVFWLAQIIILYFLYKGAIDCVKINNIDKTSLIITYVFFAWLFIEFLIACAYAKGYWMWKAVINSFLINSFYIIILLGSNHLFLHGIYKVFWKFFSPLVLISFFFFHTPVNLNYLPYSTLLLFYGLLPYKNKWILLGIVLLFFIAQEQRNDLIKMIVLGIVGISISKFYKFINKKLIKVIHAVLLVMPLVFISLGFFGWFNVFNMNEYIEGEYSQRITTGEGSEFKDDLKADTRTFIYRNVVYTLNKYDAWIIGRSPAFGDEGLDGFFEKGKDKKTGLKGRYGNEVQIMNILLWYGIVGCVLYFLLYLRASYLAIYRSKSRYIKAIGIYVAFLWVWSFVWEVSNFATYFMMNIVFLGVCYSKKFREMDETEMKVWVRTIFIRY